MAKFLSVKVSFLFPACAKVDNSDIFYIVYKYILLYFAKEIKSTDGK